jgi:hypothetical protein
MKVPLDDATRVSSDQGLVLVRCSQRGKPHPVVAEFDLRAVEGAIDRRGVELGDETALTRTSTAKARSSRAGVAPGR